MIVLFRLVQRVSRCEYFRLNSSRLGSLERNIDENERPRLGFVHSIRSPRSKPRPLLSTSPKKIKFRAELKNLGEIMIYQKKISNLSITAMPFLCLIREVVLTVLADSGTKYQPSGAGGTRSPPATPHRLQRRRGQLTLPKSKKRRSLLYSN